MKTNRLFLLILCIAGLQGCNHDDVDDGLPRLFRPYVKEIIIAENTIEFIWNESPQAQTYTVELSTDNFETEPQFSETTNERKLKFINLRYSTNYYYRIKAHSSDPAKDSKWSLGDTPLKTFDRIVPEILYPVQPEDIGETSVTLRWKTDAAYPVDRIEIVPANPTPENPAFGLSLTPTDIAAGYVLVGNLTMNATYSATIWNTAAWNGEGENYNTITFRTVGPPEGAIIVGAQDDLGTMFTTALADPELEEIIFFLAPGASYYMTNVTENPGGGYLPTASGKSYSITKSVTFMAKPGERPTLYVKNGKWSIGGSFDHFIVDGVNIKEVITSSIPFNAGSYLFSMGVNTISATVNEFIIRNSDIDLPRGIMIANGAAGGSNKIRINNVTIDHVTHTSSGPKASSGSYGFFEVTNADYDIWANMTISNSTFHNVPRMRGLFQRPAAFGSMPNIKVEKCTFYYYSTTTASAPQAGSGFYIMEMQNAASPKITVNKCLFANQINGMVRVAASGVSITQADNYYLNDMAGENQNGILVPVLVNLSSDAMFQDPANGDFTIKDKTSVVYTNGIGDPRWLK
jgi:hypothetical protein